MGNFPTHPNGGIGRFALGLSKSFYLLRHELKPILGINFDLSKMLQTSVTGAKYGHLALKFQGKRLPSRYLELWMQPEPTKKLLLIEDDPTVTEVVRIALERNGFTVTSAENLSAAHAKAETMTPEVVILDINLPDGSGFEFLREFRAQRGKDVPVLVLSGLKQEQTVIRGLELGANDFMTKPFRVRELLARVDRLVR